jgi:hypothetical protein
VAGPLAARRRPTRRVIGAAALVTAGAAVVTGLGGTNLTGLLLAFGALAARICYLAVAVGAGGFYFLYSALPRLGADRVGLYAGLVPFGAMGAAAVLSAATIVPADIGGAILVAAGVATGASAASTHPTQRRARAAAKPPEPKARGTAWTEERGTSDEGRRWLKARRRREANTARRRREKVERRHRGSAGRGRGHRVLGIHRADGGTARRGAAA